MKLTFTHKNKKINLEVKQVNYLNPRGLMFRKRKNAPTLLFEFKRPVNLAIHSYFVFFSFWAIWLDKNNNIIDARLVNPWKFHIKPKKPFYKLIEIPTNSKYINKILRRELEKFK